MEKNRLVLVEKPGGPGRLAKYRPICLLDTMDKIFDQLLALRLQTLPLSEHQHGFKQGHSTIGAVEDVLEIAQHANQGT